MARGQQKLQSQAKAAERAAKQKKQQGHSATDQKKAAQKALVHICTICKVNNIFIPKLLAKVCVQTWRYFTWPSLDACNFHKYNYICNTFSQEVTFTYHLLYFLDRRCATKLP